MFREVRFEVLGPVRGWHGDAELDLGSPQQRAVLAMLLLARGRSATATCCGWGQPCLTWTNSSSG
jgi:hypothetical protein